MSEASGSEHRVNDELAGVVERVKRADPDAWESLYRHSYPRMHAYARMRLPSGETADDAVSEAMARGIAAIGRFGGTNEDLTAWLFGILRNVVREQYRRVRHIDPNDRDLSDVVSLTPGPEAAFVAEAEASEVRKAFGLLDAEEREVLELRVVAGLDAVAVGEVLGKRPGAVRMAQSRALGRLRREVFEETK